MQKQWLQSPDGRISVHISVLDVAGGSGAETVLHVLMAPSGGQAVRIVPKRA